MTIRTPKYYKEFKCIASECKDNCCCGGWLIEIDEDTADYYRSLEGEFGNILRDSLMTDEDGDICFKLLGGRCPHLDENGLCRVLCEIGEEHTGVVCREFPRYSFTFGTVTEKGIGLACEEAARIILSDNGTFSLTETQQEQYEEPESRIVYETKEEAGLADRLLSARDEIFTLLSDRSKRIDRRIADVLEMAFDLQQEINLGGYEETASGEGEYNRQSGFDKQSGLCLLCDTDMQGSFEILTGIFDNLELLDDKWQDITKTVQKQLFDGISEEEFKVRMRAVKDFCVYDKIFENLMNYFVFRYFMKAVRDYNPLDKIRFAVCSCIMIWEMLAAGCGDYAVCENRVDCEEPGKPEMSDVSRDTISNDLISLVKTFSRQVEYSEENVEAVCEEFLFGDDFAVDRLTAMMLV